MREKNACACEEIVKRAEQTTPGQLHELASSAHDSFAEIRLPAVVVGRVSAFRNSEVLVDFPANTSGQLVASRCLVEVTQKDVGREAALAFEDGDLMKPIIIGLIRSASQSPSRAVPNIKLDEDTLVLSANKQVVIQCGRSSITLTDAGKVIIRGAYLLSRSSGVNRIKGGSVQIN